MLLVIDSTSQVVPGHFRAARYAIIFRITRKEEERRRAPKLATDVPSHIARVVARIERSTKFPLARRTATKTRPQCFAKTEIVKTEIAKAESSVARVSPTTTSRSCYGSLACNEFGAGGGTRTHTTLPSRDFKSLASTSSATSALVARSDT